MDPLSLLGVALRNTLHVNNMVSKANSRKYFLVVLKHCGVGLQDLVKCYCSFVRPILEYAVQVRHPGLTSGQSELLERVQKHVLRSLLPEANYSEAPAATGLATLEQRWVELCGRFASALQESPEFCD